MLLVAICTASALTPSWASESFESLLGTCAGGQGESILSRLIPQRGTPAGRADRLTDALSGRGGCTWGDRAGSGKGAPPRL